MSPLSAWVTFYVIVGSAGVLIGLTFVVMTLVAGRVTRHGLSGGGSGHTIRRRWCTSPLCCLPAQR